MASRSRSTGPDLLQAIQVHLQVPALLLSVLFVAACAGPEPVALSVTEKPTPTPTAPSSTPTPRGPASTAMATPTVRQHSPQTRTSGFVPLDDPAFIAAGSAAFMGNDDLVLGYSKDGEARAYPVSMLHWHHIINDTVQGTPLLVTY